MKVAKFPKDMTPDSQWPILIPVILGGGGGINDILPRDNRDIFISQRKIPLKTLIREE